MDRTLRLVTPCAIAATLVALAHAQSPSNSSPTPTARRSIVQHYPLPYPEYYHGDQSAGFRNPGNVGRYAEYYPPGNQFQVQRDPVRVANFDRGGGRPTAPSSCRPSRSACSATTRS